MRILGPIVHQQQNIRGADRIGEEIEKFLRLVIDPVQVFEDHHQRLIERFAQQQPFDGFEGTALLDLRIHLQERVLAFDDSQQRVEVRNGIFQRAIEFQQLSEDLLSTPAAVVFRSYFEIAV